MFEIKPSSIGIQLVYNWCTPAGKYLLQTPQGLLESTGDCHLLETPVYDCSCSVPLQRLSGQQIARYEQGVFPTCISFQSYEVKT